MPSRGVWPSETGESWFGVLVTLRPEPSCTSQVQPLPKRATPASLTCFLRSSRLPKVSLISSARAPLGSPPPAGLMVSQEKGGLRRLATAAWAHDLPEEGAVGVAAGVVAARPLLVVGQRVEILEHVLDRLVGPL